MVMIIATILLSSALVLPGSAPKGWQHHNGGYRIVPVARASGNLPLSDQANAGGWVKNDAMTDEFNGSSLDRSKWNYNIGDWTGPQPCWYSDANVTVRDGMLSMTLRYDTPPENLRKQGYNTYSGAALTSIGTASEGYFEARAKPSKSHASSAFWFHHNVDQWWHEIDVFEISGGNAEKARDMNIGVHVFRSPVEAKFDNVDGPYKSADKLADDFHVYGLEWTQAELKFYYDGRLVLSGPNLYWHQPSHMSFDTDILKDWFGLPEPSELPAVFQVDYVRAWKKRA
jgi:beta-glucanase (GH16 family)